LYHQEKQEAFKIVAQGIYVRLIIRKYEREVLPSTEIVAKGITIQWINNSFLSKNTKKNTKSFRRKIQYVFQQE
jgi:hypothetical protein